MALGTWACDPGPNAKTNEIKASLTVVRTAGGSSFVPITVANKLPILMDEGECCLNEAISPVLTFAQCPAKYEFRGDSFSGSRRPARLPTNMRGERLHRRVATIFRQPA